MVWSPLVQTVWIALLLVLLIRAVRSWAFRRVVRIETRAVAQAILLSSMTRTSGRPMKKRQPEHVGYRIKMKSHLPPFPESVQIVGSRADGRFVRRVGVEYRIAKTRVTYLDSSAPALTDTEYDEYVLVFSSLSNAWVYLYRPLLEHHLKRGRAG
jgi:hypothetical protein